MTDKNLENKEIATEQVKVTTAGKSTTLVWISSISALLAWICLIWFNGYVGIGFGLAGLVSGFAATLRSEGSPRRVAITAVVASAVVVVVLLSFLIVIKIALAP